LIEVFLIEPKSEIQLSEKNFFFRRKDEIDLSIIFLIVKTCMVYMWWSKIEIRIYSSLEIKQELNCESALSECNDEHLQMCMYGQHEHSS
jgi:hypothetical protein